MTPDDPIRLFRDVFERARQACLDDPTAMVLSTGSPGGRPAGRFVLLKDVDERGFVFYTNLDSRKAAELRAHPFAALCFYWAPLGVQVRIEGGVELVTGREADEYFASRPREHQIGAWASQQSAVIPSLEALDARYRKLEQEFEGQAVPRPPYWSGYRVIPETIEFWTFRPRRLHERRLFRRTTGGWTESLLAP